MLASTKALPSCSKYLLACAVGTRYLVRRFLPSKTCSINLASSRIVNLRCMVAGEAIAFSVIASVTVSAAPSL